MKTVLKTLMFVFVAFLTTACSGSNPVAPEVTPQTQFEVPVSETAQFEVRTIDGKSWTVPKGIDLDAYPLLGGVLSARDAKLLGLHKETLKEDQIFLNELRERRTFEAANIKAGSEVWVDKNGVVRYLVSCGNRLQMPKVIEACPFTVFCPAGLFKNPDGTLVQGAKMPHEVRPTPTPVASDDDATAKKALADEAAKKATSGGWSFPLGWAAWNLLKIFMFLVLAAILGAILYTLWDLLRNEFRRNPPVLPAPVVPAPAPTPVVPVPPVRPVPVAPVVAIPPAQVVRRYGPFRTVGITDRGANGYRISGDGRDVGTFQLPGRVEVDAFGNQYFVIHEAL
jgi:hypothetical protein